MKMRTRSSLIGIVLILPSAAGLILFYFVPFCMSVYYSFSKVSGRFVPAGLTNYESVLSSEVFRVAFGNTFAFLGLGLVLMLTAGFLLALLINKVSRYSRGLSSFGAAALLLPLVLPAGAVLMFFQVLAEPYGVLNGLLVQLDVEPVRWLRSERAFSILMLLFLWKNTGYTVVMLLSGLLSVPDDMLEAARLDGAHGCGLFFCFTFVHMLPFFSISAVMGIMSAFKMYRESYMLFGKYPYQSVYMLQNYLYNNFVSLNYQRLTSASVLFTLALGVVLIPLLRVGLRECD